MFILILEFHKHTWSPWHKPHAMLGTFTEFSLFLSPFLLLLLLFLLLLFYFLSPLSPLSIATLLLSYPAISHLGISILFYNLKL